MKNYRKRVSDEILAFKLESAGAVLVEGVKWCGKTTTSEQIAKSCVYLDEIRDKVGNLDILKVNIAMALDGERPHLIDEWQFAPFLWDSVRHHVDHVGSGNPCRIRLHQASVRVVHARIEQHQQAEPRIRPSVEDVAEDRQREVTESLRRGIVPQQRQR